MRILSVHAGKKIIPKKCAHKGSAVFDLSGIQSNINPDNSPSTCVMKHETFCLDIFLFDIMKRCGGEGVTEVIVL